MEEDNKEKCETNYYLCFKLNFFQYHLDSLLGFLLYSYKFKLPIFGLIIIYSDIFVSTPLFKVIPVYSI